MTDTTMLYRPGDTVNPDAWNLPIDTTIVADEDIETALSDGWCLHPQDFPSSSREPGPYGSILDASVKDIVPLLEGLSAAELSAMRAAEEGGKTRAGLLAELDKAIAAKAA